MKKSDLENHDTSERDGCYRPITTSPEDELNLHTDGELNTGENKTENISTENSVTRSNRESKQPSRYGLQILETFGYELTNLKCYMQQMEQPTRNATTASQTSGLCKRKKTQHLEHPECKQRRANKGECNTVPIYMQYICRYRIFQ